MHEIEKKLKRLERIQEAIKELQEFSVGDEVVLDNGSHKYIRKIEKSTKLNFFVAGWWFSKKNR